MGTSIIKYIGTGRAKCGICQKLIKEREIGLGLIAYGFRSSSRFHSRCVKKLLKIDKKT